MNAEDLRNLLENTDDKFSIFININPETQNKYDLYLEEFLDLISDFLDDKQKLELFDYPLYQNFSNDIRCGIICRIYDENIKFQILDNDKITYGFTEYDMLDFVKTFSDDGKKQLLYKDIFFTNAELEYIISSLDDKTKEEILTDNVLINNKLHLENYQIATLAKSLSNEETKINIINSYELENYLKVDIINTLSDDNKLNVLLNENNFYKYDKIQILASFNTDALANFIKCNKNFCTENNIHPYEITSKLDAEKQIAFVYKLDDIDLELSDKKQILLALKPEVKQSIDMSKLPIEYQSTLSIKTKETGVIILDLNKNLEDYRGLDNLMPDIYPEQFTESQKAQFMQLCGICPNMTIINNLTTNSKYASTSAEYKQAEEWITSIIDNLNPEYSQAQKLAVIDNAIGKKLSYSPDFGTEVFNKNDCRALWKIISSGYGVCNGIAKIEQYMLSRVGIKSEIIVNTGQTHAFLKIKNIELPLANGEIVKGDTIVDPTWNLAAHRFGSKPLNFCINYDQARENDTDLHGADQEVHKNDKELQDITLGLDDQSLRNLFTSIGLADKYGFPVVKTKELSNLLHKAYQNDPNQNINKQFLLLSKICPEFATCQNSSMSILSIVLLKNPKFKFNKCAVNRVFDKSDKEKKPILYVYINSDELGEKFYYADKTRGQFIELPKDEFTNQFECYNTDLKKLNGIRPWESEKQLEENIDLSTSSGKIVSNQGDGR